MGLTRRVSLFLALCIAGSASLFAQAQLTITNSPPTGTFNVPYSFQFAATGGVGPYQWSYNTDASNLPPGVRFNSPAGTLSGVPTQAGSFRLQVFVFDPQTSEGGSGTFTITIQLAVTNTPPGAMAGTPYNFKFAAAGGSGNYTWTWTPTFGSQLPPGLALSPAGAISGTPTQSGTYTFSVQVSDNQAAALTGSANISFTVASCTPAFITPGTLTSGDVNAPYTQAVTINGCTPPYTFALTPSAFSANQLPPGLGLTQPPSGSASAIISGAPTAAATNPYTFNLTVTEAYKGTATASFSLQVNPQLVIGASSPLPSATAGQAYSQSLMPNGGSTPYYSITLDNPLPGLTLDSPSGLLHGTPPASAISSTPYSFNATLIDNIAVQVKKAFQLSIVAATPLLQITPTSLSFSGVMSGGAPADQALSVAPTAAATSGATYQVLVDGGAVGTKPGFGLTVRPASGSAPAQLVVSVDQTGVQSTNNSARIRIIDNGGTETDIPVSLTLSSPNTQAQVVPSRLRYASSTQTPGTFEQDIAITSPGATSPVGFSAKALHASSWISSVTASGQTVRNSSAFVRVTVNSQGQTVGSHTDVIRVSYAGGSVDVPISLFVRNGGPVLGVSVTGLRYQAQQGGGFTNGQTVKILDLGDASSTVNWSAKIVAGSDTVSLGTASGTATPAKPGLLPINLASGATQLAPGGHYALISITDSNAQNSPVYIIVVLDLAASGSAPLPDPSPAGLFFVVAAAGAQSAAQSVSVNTSSPQAVTFQVAASTTDGGTWLVVNPASGQTSGQTAGTFTVAVNPAGMTAGVYTGQASASINGVVRTVNITVVVLPQGSTVPTSAFLPTEAPRAATCAPSKLALTEVGLVNNFSVPAKWPATLIVQLNDDCANAVTNGAVIASFSNGDAPVSLLNGGQGSSYSATWQPSATSSQMEITLNATSPTLAAAAMQLVGGVSQNQAVVPTLVPSGTLNNLNPVVGDPLAPGTIAQVYGSGLASSSVSPGVIPIPTTFNGTYALVGPYQVPLYYLSSGQLNIEIPSELVANQQFPVLVSVNNALTLPDTLDITKNTPGVLSYLDGPTPPNVQDGAHIIAQHNADFSLVDATHPAKSGEYITIYLVGMGPTNPTVASGAAAPSSPLALVSDSPTLTVDGKTIAGGNIAFAGLTPYLVGLYQMTFQVPSNLSSSLVDVVVTQNGHSANTTKLPAAP